MATFFIDQHNKLISKISKQKIKVKFQDFETGYLSTHIQNKLFSFPQPVLELIFKNFVYFQSLPNIIAYAYT